MTASVREGASAFDEMRDAVETAELSLDIIDQSLGDTQDVVDSLDLKTPAEHAELAFWDFAEAISDVGVELTELDTAAGQVIGNMTRLFSNPVDFAANTLGAVLQGLLTLEDFGGALGLDAGFFKDPTPGSAEVAPKNISAQKALEADQTHHAGLARYLDTDDPQSQIGMLKQNDPGIFQRHNTREFIEKNYPELVDVIYPKGGASVVRHTPVTPSTTEPSTGSEAGAPAQTEQEIADALERQNELKQEALALDVAIAKNRRETADYNLEISGSESEFESNRQKALLLTQAYFDAEKARIDGLIIGEAERQVMLDRHALDRRKAIDDLTTAENEYTTIRVEGEEEAAEAAQKAIDDKAKADAKAAEDAQKLADTQARDDAKATEDQAKADAKAEADRIKAMEAAAEKEAKLTIDLAKNTASEAQYNLTRSGSEDDFEVNRQKAIDAENAYFDVLEAHAKATITNERELQETREDIALSREKTIDRLIDRENKFATLRISNEQKAAEAAIQASEDAAEAALKSAEEQQAALEKLEQERQDAISGVRSLL